MPVSRLVASKWRGESASAAVARAFWLDWFEPPIWSFAKARIAVSAATCNFSHDNGDDDDEGCQTQHDHRDLMRFMSVPYSGAGVGAQACEIREHV